MALVACVLAMGLGGSAGCVAPEEVATCERVEDYLTVCYFECLAGWDCIRRYREASEELQPILEHCSRCLAREAELSCHDCLGPSGDSCQDLLVEELGLVCDW